MSDTVEREELLKAQRNEISEYQIYSWLAGRISDEKNREILKRIAEDEKKHYGVFREVTGEEVGPRKLRVFWFKIISRVFGLSFGLRLMEKGEEVTRRVYSRLKEELPEVADVILDEQKHEAELLGMIQEERIEYAGSIVLGLNDALVELSGALAGLTFALQNSNIIAMTGFITGVAASMSMAASGFLSARENESEDDATNPLKSAAYTGITYLITVMILILPYLLIGNVYLAFGIMVAESVLIILLYNFYITTAKGVGLWKRFGTMAVISVGVAGISFLVGILARKMFGVEV